MNLLAIPAILVVLFLAGELACRIHYYGRRPGLGTGDRVRLILFGRWLVPDALASPNYLKEIADSLGVGEGFMNEVLATAAGKEPAEVKRIFSGRGAALEGYRFEPLVGFLPAPGQRNGHTTTNSSGFRGEERPREKPFGVKRALLLGGSVAFGRTATSDGATIAARFERALNDGPGTGQGSRWEVINLAVPAFISRQELLVLLKYGLACDPDWVISFSGFNDAHHYLETGRANEMASLSQVTRAYEAFVSSPGRRAVAFLGTYLVSVYYLSRLAGRRGEAGEEEISPFIYTIW